MNSGTPQFSESTGTIEPCLEAGWSRAGSVWKRKNTLDNIHFTAVSRDEQLPKQLQLLSMEKVNN